LMMSAQMGSLFGEASMVEVEPHVGKMSAGAIDRMDAASAGPMLDALIGFAMDPLDIARMSIPALFLAGEEDLYTPPWMVERTARLWPGARFQVLPNVAHIVPREAPADLARLTLQFLSDNGI
ncbi:MAG TPA: alpha/beta hydrolase, partial [Fibrobacteria bacterium]|nr:alpha/beta hydrolase [Fibrobacteria bacterium]